MDTPSPFSFPGDWQIIWGLDLVGRVWTRGHAVIGYEKVWTIVGADGTIVSSGKAVDMEQSAHAANAAINALESELCD